MTDQAGEIPSKRIGLLFVHGVGEQGRFDHLINETRQLVRAIGTLYRDAVVSVEVRRELSAPVGSPEPIWQADQVAPVTVHLRWPDGSGRPPVEIDIHEVWWADLDERVAFRSRVRFWLWGLGKWATVGAEHRGVVPTDGADGGGGKVAGHRRLGFLERWWVRCKLFVVANVFFALYSVLLLQRGMTILGFKPKGNLPTEILQAYLGDVRLMSQPERETGGVLEDLGLPPRVAVRRRMVQALVKMALADYDRWYILAHSLGTVVAQNGLAETEQALPNYLDRQAWATVRGGSLRKSDADHCPPVMMPRRPGWLEPTDAIDRPALFANLKGLLTYGSPLDKFAALWPYIVPRNRQPAFSEDFRWWNIFDETDPVAGKLDEFGPPEGVRQPDGLRFAVPANTSVKACPVLLLSHIKYLSHRPRRRDAYKEVLLRWIVEGDPATFDADRRNMPDGNGLRFLLRLFSWGVVQVLAAALAGWLIVEYLAPDDVTRWIAGQFESHLPGLLPPGVVGGDWLGACWHGGNGDAYWFCRIWGCLPVALGYWIVGTAMTVIVTVAAGVIGRITMLIDGFCRRT